MADEAAREGEEGLVDVGAPLVADRQPPKALQLRQRPLDAPVVAAEPPRRLDAHSGNAALDASLAPRRPAPLVVVALVGVALGRAAVPAPGRGPDGRHRVERGLETPSSRVGWPGRPGQRAAPRGRPDVELAAGLAAVGRVAAGPVPPSPARRRCPGRRAPKAIRSARPNSSGGARCGRSQTPACRQSRRRRQQVAGLAAPGPRGTADHGVPVHKLPRPPRRWTTRMPHRAARSSTKGRPPLGRGRRGARTFHRPSETWGRSMTPWLPPPHRLGNVLFGRRTPRRRRKRHAVPRSAAGHDHAAVKRGQRRQTAPRPPGSITGSERRRGPRASFLPKAWERGRGRGRASYPSSPSASSDAASPSACRPASASSWLAKSSRRSPSAWVKAAISGR